MAELDAQLRFDIDAALRDINQLEGALDRALGSVELRLDSTAAQRQLNDLAQQADQALGDVDIDFDAGSASRLNSELNGVERSLEIADREADELAGSLRGAARAASDVDGSAGRLATAFSSIRGSAAGLIAGFGAFAAIRGAIGFATDAKDAFATLQDSANAVKVVFGDAVGTIEAFGESVAQSAGLSTAEFNQAASVLGSALLNVGFSADIAATKTVELTQRAADMASIFGGPVGDALGAIQSALRGETDPIERFGVSLSEAAVNAQAAALGFQTVAGEFSTSEKAAARLDLIMQQTARTSGDFANTSGDLANAQKVLAAEFENAKASLGEALLPIFQSLLDIGPEVIASIEQLAPSFQAFAISLGNLLEHREGAADLLDVLEGLADIPRAFGALGTIFTAIGDAEGASQRFTEQINTQGLIDDLREGTDAAGALSFRLAEVGRTGKLSPQFIRDLTRIAGVDMRGTIAALKEVLVQAKNFNLADDEIRNVAVALAQLQSAGESSEADRAMARAAIAAGELATVAPVAVSGLSDLQRAAGEAGVSMGELLTSTDPLAVALREGLTPAQELALAIHGVGEDAAVAADVLNTALGPAVSDAGQALIDFNKNGQVSLKEFIRGLEETVAAALAFQANMLALAAADPAIIPIVLDLPEDEQARFAQLLVDDPVQIPAVIDAAQIDSSELAANLQEIARQAIDLLKRNPSEEQIAEFTAAMTLVDVPGGAALARKALNLILTGSTEGLTPPELTAIYVASIEGMSQSDILAALNPALNASWADVTLEPPTDQVAAAFEGIELPALQVSFADFVHPSIELPTLTPLFQEALDASFADLDPPTYPKPKLPPPPTAEEKARVGDQILELFERDDALNEAAGFTADTFNDRLIVEMGARAFATQQDLDAFITTNFTQKDAATTAAEATSGAYSDGVADVDLGDLDIADQIAATFGADDVLTASLLAGRAAGDAFWDGATSKYVTPKVKTAVNEIISDAIGWKSPPKLFLDAGIASGDAFWMGFEQADLSLRVPVPQMTGKISTSTAAAADGGAGFTFAPTYVNTETKDLETVVARSEQLMGAVSGILNGRFKL